ncbi:MAG TPA: IS21 family transposase [Thermomicrobiales bacterium]|nr:IS21 family transposase [Thermomicrobiales bacterium]
MLKYMDRSTIYYLKQKGWTNTQIAALMGHHRDTIARVLREPVDREPTRRARPSAVAAFHEQIEGWLDRRLPVRRMLELAREDPDHPYRGSDAAFYQYVRPLAAARRALPGDVALRFEGLPGELLQLDWGAARQFPFTAPALAGQTRYFFAARLKYSRWMWVRFTADMQEETLLRCLVACFVELGGVPWVVTSDNMKTITLGRDAQHQPLWHPAYRKFAAEFAFHPAVCAPAAANQKGAVENLVKFVRSNFLAGRAFHDDAELAAQVAAWLRRVNEERPSGATGRPPAALLAAERPHLGPLPPAAHDYGLVDSVLVSHEGLVTIATNRYSVPAHLVGRALTARLYPARIELYAGAELVATHPRHGGRHARIVVPEHYEAVFALKPRARALVYRDWLVALAPAVADYVALLCRRRYGEMEAQLCALYDLAQQLDRARFLRAVERALAQEAVGAEYVRALALPPPAAPPAPPPGPGWPPPSLAHAPDQRAVERDLADYERYVANRAATGTGGA